MLILKRWATAASHFHIDSGSLDPISKDSNFIAHRCVGFGSDDCGMMSSSPRMLRASLNQVHVPKSDPPHTKATTSLLEPCRAARIFRCHAFRLIESSVPISYIDVPL